MVDKAKLEQIFRECFATILEKYSQPDFLEKQILQYSSDGKTLDMQIFHKFLLVEGFFMNAEYTNSVLRKLFNE